MMFVATVGLAATTSSLAAEAAAALGLDRGVDSADRGVVGRGDRDGTPGHIGMLDVGRADGTSGPA